MLPIDIREDGGDHCKLGMAMTIPNIHIRGSRASIRCKSGNEARNRRSWYVVPKAATVADQVRPEDEPENAYVIEGPHEGETLEEVVK